MHFKCPRCARRHAFPAARMNAAGRVPCRCGVTLVLQPPRGGRSLSGADLADADIVTLGYTIGVERVTGTFDNVRQELREALGIDGAGPGVPEPGKAARPQLLWPALGLAFDPRLCVPAAAALFAGVSARWAVGSSGPLAALAGPAIATLGGALAAAVATTGAAAAAHDALTDGRRLSAGAVPRALRARSGLTFSAARDAGLGAALTALLLATVAALAGLETRGGGAAAVARWSAPVQALLVLGALGVAAGVVHRLLAHAALIPQARGLLLVQVTLELRRIVGERRLVPARSLAPALVAAVVLALALASAARLVVGTWDAVVGGFGALPAVARAVGRDVVWAAAGGVLCAYVGVTGLVAGYALGTGASREPVRAPEIITGTQQSLLAGKLEDDAEK